MTFNEKGVTLVELIVGMLMLILILGAVAGVISSTTKLYNYANNQGENVQDSRQAFTQITNEIHYATAINSIAANKLTYNTNKTIEFDSTNNAIIMTTGGATTQTFGRNRIVSVVFEDVTPANGTRKRQINVTIHFITGDSIVTRVTTINDMS